MTKIRRKYLRGALMGSAAWAVMAVPVVSGNSAVYAQDQASDDAVVDRIVITGSRLKTSATSSSVPLLQIDIGDIQNRGVVRLEEMLNILPQFAASQTANISNGATGTSTLNLRGLGANRTLVLVNGRRLPFGSPRFAPANIDIVPSSLIERIDIVTGGGSAVYGSDAVGGIANFILKDDFEGIEISGQVGIHHAPNQNSLMSDILAASNINDPSASIDGREVAISFTAGTNFDEGRGNVTISVGYQNANEVSQADRDFSACALSSGSGVNRNATCAGSSNFRKFTQGSDPDRLRHINGRIVRPGDPDFDMGTGFSEVFQEADGTLVVRGTSSEDETFNFGPTNFFRRPNERYNINALANYEITDNLEIYTDLAFMNNRSAAQIAASASFSRPFNTNCDNPLLQGGPGPNNEGITLFELFDCQQVLDDFAAGTREDVDIRFTNSHRNVEGGNRISDIDNTQWRIVTGLRGTLAERFDWDMFGQISRVNEMRTSMNDLNFNDVQQALFVITDPDTGKTVCRDGSNGCVPWNIFDRTGSGDTLVTQDAADFIAGLGITIGRTEQRVLGGTIQGDFTEDGFVSPFAESGLSVLGGWEYRRDTLNSIPDDISQVSGGRGLTGQGGGTLPVAGRISVWEVFMEGQLPLVENEPFMEELILNGAYRHSEYSVDGNGVQNSFGANTYFVGGTWAPDSNLRLRAQFQRAIRAPNVIDLFTGQNTGLFGAVQLSNGAFEPCGGPNPTATLAQCQNSGLSAAQFGLVPLQPAGQLNTITGGNPNLEAEVSDTLTIGAVFTPTFVPGLTIAIDYFDIQIDGAISTIPPQTTLDTCIETGNPVFCSLIKRDIFGSLHVDNSNFEGITATNVNIASLTRKGFDVQADYSLPLDDIGLGGFGDVRFNLAGSLVTKDLNTPIPGGDVTICDGLFGGACGIPNPKWRHVFRTTWDTPWDFSSTLTWRYTKSTKNSGTISDPTDLNLAVPAVSYLDLVVNYQVNDNADVRFGINNLFAKTPHFLSQGNNGNIFAGQFDIDRFIFFGVNLTY